MRRTAGEYHGEGQGENPGHTHKKFGLAKLRLLGRLVEREAANKENNIVGDLAYRKRKGGSAKARTELAFILWAQS